MRMVIDELLCDVARLDVARDILTGVQSDLLFVRGSDLELERTIRKIQDEMDRLYFIRRDLEKSIDRFRKEQESRQRGE